MKRLRWLLGLGLALLLGAQLVSHGKAAPIFYRYVPLIVAQVTRTPTATATFTVTPTITQTPTRTATPFVNAPPPYSTSLYMRTIDPQTYFNLGCQRGERDHDLPGTQDSIVVLDFGQPTDDASGYGANLFGYGPATTTQIATAVEQFAAGYLACIGDDTTSHLRIGIGTSNYGTKVYYMHGRNWAKMVTAVNVWLKTQGYYARVDAAGASDIELSWNTVANSRDWVNGYDSSNYYNFYNFGDAAGCPMRSYPYWTCNNGWSQDDIYYVSFGAGPAYPLPLIYSTEGANAQQWASISLYGYTHHGARMEIAGAFTQWQACQQFPNGCGYHLDNTPAQGWTMLFNELNRDARTAQGLLWSTDIKWQGY